MNCKSLRELQTQISHNNKLKKFIIIPSVSQFSRKNASRDSRIFEDIFYYLISKAKKHPTAVAVGCKFYFKKTNYLLASFL